MISLILMILAGVCKAVMDTLQFHFHESVFTHKQDGVVGLLKDRFWNPEMSWINKYKDGDKSKGEKFFGSSTVFVAFTDGWHLFGMLNHFLIVAAIVLYSPITPIKIKVLSILVDFLIIKITHQSVFHAFYTWIFRKNNK